MTTARIFLSVDIVKQSTTILTFLSLAVLTNRVSELPETNRTKV
jgi:hypothetical protein